jgi:small GTP-binding protein
MDALRKVIFRGNQLFDDDDLETVSEYFKDLTKITIIGDSNTGKTSLMKRVTCDEFSEAYVPTIGVDFRTKSVCVMSESPRIIKAQIWDTSGDDRYADIVRSYTRGYCIVLVFDVTNETSFNRIRDYWVPMVGMCEHDVRKVILVGNKCDDEENRVVSAAQAIALVDGMGIDMYLDVSAKKRIRVDDAFAALVGAVLNS